jgi:hypothetical protein
LNKVRRVDLISINHIVIYYFIKQTNYHFFIFTYDLLFKRIKLLSDLNLNYQLRKTKKNEFRTDRFKNLDEDESEHATKVFAEIIAEIKQNKFKEVIIPEKSKSITNKFQILQSVAKFDFDENKKKLIKNSKKLFNNFGLVADKPNYVELVNDLFEKEEQNSDQE